MQNEESNFSSQLQADGLYFQADNFLNDSKYAEARQFLEEAVKIDPTHVQALNALGWLYERKYYDYQKALKCYQAALKSNPNYAPTHLNYCYLLSLLERYEEFELQSQAAMQVAGINKPRLIGEMGIVEERRGNLVKALKIYKEAMKLSISNEDVDMFKGDIERCESKMK